MKYLNDAVKQCLEKRMLKNLFLGLSFIAFPLISGCQTGYVSTGQSQVLSLSILAEESQKAVLAQESLKNARVDQMKNLQVQQAKFNVDVINANYIGTPEVLLNSIANHSGYRYLETGYQRTLPIVNFTNRKQTAFELVKDIAVFINGSANIIVDNQNKTITLSYVQQ